MNKSEKIGLIGIIFIIGLLVLFFGTKKINYHCDEVWTYGLANHLGGIKPEYETGVKYSGMGPYENFMVVEKGHGFNYFNVWENQAKDVHPPLYYLLIHTVCSFFSGSFSKWFGISVNIFWMILMIPVMYLLVRDITESKFSAFSFVAIYGTTVLFLDTMLLIRMYAQFTFFTILLSYIFCKYWDKELNKKFLISLGVTLFLGMLSHYYFLIYAFAMCLFFGIRLIVKKRFIDVKRYLISIVTAGIVYGVIWYHILAHIFNGYRGEEAIDKFTTLGGYFNGALDLFGIINNEVFYGLMILFCIFTLIWIVFGWKHGRIKQLDCFVSGIVFSAVFYILIVGKIAPISTSRYVMAVGWIFCFIAYIAVRNLCKYFSENKIFEVAILLAFLVINLLNIYSRGFSIPMDFDGDDYQKLLEAAKGKEAVVYMDSSWKLVYDYAILQEVTSYTIGDENNIDEIINSQDDDYILIEAVDDDRAKVSNGLKCELLYRYNDNCCYLVSSN